MELEELIEVLPSGYILSRKGSAHYYYNNIAYYMQSEPQYFQYQGETFTEFIERIIKGME